MEGKNIDGFLILEQIGSGASSKVHLAQHVQTKLMAAAKIVDVSKLKTEEFNGVIREISVYMNVVHPNVCTLYRLSFFDTYIIFFLQYAANGTLLSYLNKKKQLNDEEARKIFIQVFDAIRYLHVYHFCAHRDIKLENILLDENNNVLITDFGFSGSCYNSILHSFVGTPGYYAPEVMAGNEYTEKCDVWSLGVCLFTLLSGYMPFSTKTNKFRTIVEEAVNLKYPRVISPLAVDLLRRMFTVNPSSRPSLIDLQSHHWLHGLPQMNLNITPQPIMFYKVSNIEAIRKFRRKPMKPIPDIAIKVEALGYNVKDLEEMLNDGKINDETTAYFIYLHPSIKKAEVEGTTAGEASPIHLRRSNSEALPMLNQNTSVSKRRNSPTTPPDKHRTPQIRALPRNNTEQNKNMIGLRLGQRFQKHLSRPIVKLPMA